MNRVINILLVEDDNLDVINVQRTLERMHILYRIKIARNGEEGIAMLSQQDESTFKGLPDIILLDLNMPKMNGLEFLEQLRANHDWKDIKVFVITTSEESNDKKLATKFGISGYIIKPLKLNSPATIDAMNLMIDLINL